jgi:hypothetical protein
LNAQRIADPDEMIHRGRSQAYSDMEVNLLLLGDLQSCSEVQQVPRPIIFRKVAGVFDKGIPRLRQLTIYKERRFASHISRAALSGPTHREHPGRVDLWTERAIKAPAIPDRTRRWTRHWPRSEN